ncbi:MAG: hypothetical protein IT168_15595 [Bryobacterales bacterium]|nr:hypothetical protein [Bryobacterales bacterium]
MPTIPLGAGLGIEADGSLAPGANLLALVPNFQQLAPLSLGVIPQSQLETGLKFSHDLSLTGDLGLTIAAGATGKIRVLRDKGRALDDDDPFDAVKVKEGETYLAFSFTASVNPEINASAGPIAFGLAPGVSHEWRIYRRFPSGLEFGKALGLTLHEFRIPQSRKEMADLRDDVVIVVGGSGTTSITAEFRVTAPVTALASLTIPGGQSVNINPNASFSISPRIELSGGYQVRMMKLDRGLVEIGLYRFKSREAELGLTAKAALPVKVGSFELTEQIIRALTIGEPVVNAQELMAALPGADDAFSKKQRIERLELRFRKAVDTKLALSANAALGRLKSQEAAWTFKVDPKVQSLSADEAVAHALKGRFDDMLSNVPGVTRSSSVFTDRNTRTVRLSINLLGLANFGSVTKLVASSEVTFNGNDQITMITDRSEASRVEQLLVNFGRDGRRLRGLMQQSFLIEATYKASGLFILPPERSAKYTYFEIHDKTGAPEMRNNLQVLRSLGLLPPDKIEGILAKGPRFGRTTFYVEAEYDKTGVDALFFEGDEPKPQHVFEDAGRSALGALVAGDEDRKFSALFAGLGLKGNELWDKMKRLGFAEAYQAFGLGKLEAQSNAAFQAAVTDFLTILNWAQAMAQAAAAAADVRTLLKGETVASDDPRFEEGRKRLQTRMSAVVAKTGEHFGDPLGLVMVEVASHNAGKVEGIVTSEATGRMVLGVPEEIAKGAGE